MTRFAPLLLLAACAAQVDNAGTQDLFDPPPGCPASGPSTRTIDAGGAARTYDLYIPEKLRGSAAGPPVVMYFHPLVTDKDYLQIVGTHDKADTEGFVAVYPDGIGSSWNAGACCAPANGAGGAAPVDDVAFARAIAADLTAGCFDPARIYAAGFSNGGFLAHRLACEASDVFAAIAPVSAVNGVPDACTPGRPVPVLELNGTADTLVPYEGGFSLDGVTNGAFIGARASIAGWVARDHCAPTPVVDRHATVTCETYSGCDGGAEVTLCTLDGSGHCWFGEPLCILGADKRDLKATDATWAFLRRFSR